jgi:hypothetical protein
MTATMTATTAHTPTGTTVMPPTLPATAADQPAAVRRPRRRMRAASVGTAALSAGAAFAAATTTVVRSPVPIWIEQATTDTRIFLAVIQVVVGVALIPMIGNHGRRA